MSFALTSDQPSPEVQLTDFLKSAVNSKQIDTSQLSSLLASTPVDLQLLCLKSVHHRNGRYLLHHAVYDHMPGVVECIRTHLGSEQFHSLVGQADILGRLPLHYAFASIDRGVVLESVEMMIDLLLGSFDDVKRCRLVKQAMSGTRNLLFYAEKVQTPSLVLKVLSLLEQKEIENFAETVFEEIPLLHHFAGYCDQGDLVTVLEWLSDEVLFKSMSRIDLKGVTLLHCISSWDYAEAIRKIFARLSIDQFCQLLAAKDECGMGPMHYAVENKAWNALTCLINILPCPQLVTLLGMQDGDCNTPFLSIIEGGNDEIKTLLLRKTFDHLVGQVRRKESAGRSHYESESRYMYSAGEVEDEVGHHKDVEEDQPEIISLRERVSELEKDVQVKVSQLKELQAKIAELEVKVKTTEGQPEVINLKEKCRKLEREMQVKDTQVEALTTANAELRLRNENVERRTQARAEQDPSEIISSQERASELGREVQIKDSQIKDQSEITSLMERVGELEREVQVKATQIEELQAKIDELKVKVKTTEGSQADESEEEGSFDSNEEDSLTFTDYTNSALPEELHQAILDLCQRRKVDRAKVLQGPLSFKDVTVVGVGVEKIGDGDLSELREKWSEHCSSISVLEESSEPSDEEFYGDNSSGISKFPLSQPPPIGGVCELVAIVEHAELRQTAYLVGTAHCVLPPQRLQHLRNGTAHSQVRELLDVDAQDCHYRVLFRPRPNEEEFVDAFHVPLFGYRCDVQENAGDDRMYNGIDLRRCRNDMALLRIDPTKAEDLYHALNGRPGRNDRLVEMYSRDKLEKYTRPPREGPEIIRIYVKEHYGSLTFSPNANGQLAPDDLYHLRFVLDNNEQLGPGDSGSVVYQVGKKDGQRSLRPLGLLIGRSRRKADLKADTTIYLAAFIDLAFQDIKGEYGEVNGIRLMYARPRRPRQVRPGEQNLPAQS